MNNVIAGLLENNHFPEALDLILNEKDLLLGFILQIIVDKYAFEQEELLDNKRLPDEKVTEIRRIYFLFLDRYSNSITMSMIHYAATHMSDYIVDRDNIRVEYVKSSLLSYAIFRCFEIGKMKGLSDRVFETIIRLLVQFEAPKVVIEIISEHFKIDDLIARYKSIVKMVDMNLY
jgi:hypothetical protein